jgi:hypothetical protein
MVVEEIISKMYFSHWMPPGVAERMRSVNLDASISGEYQTVGGHSCRRSDISNNRSFRLEHPGIPDGSDGSDGTSYPLTENYMLPVAQVTGRVAQQSAWECRRQTWERLGAP